MTHEDLEHKLLSGGVIHIDGCPTYKVTLKEMADVGFTKVQNVIGLLSLEDSSASRFITGVEDDELSTYHVLAIGFLQDLYKKQNGAHNKDDLLCDVVLTFLTLFFKQKVFFDECSGFVVKNEDDEIIFILNEDNYSQFRNVLRYRNCLIDIDDIADNNPANEMAAKLLEKRRMLREKIHNSKKAQGEDGLTMADLISIFAEAESMPIQDVYQNYDIYQFNNQFNRLKIMDDFKVNIQALLAGAKAEDIKLKHWLSKINNKEER